MHDAHNQTPRRRFLLTLKLGADSREDLIRALDQMALEMRQGYLMGPCVSGGYSYGYDMKVCTNQSSAAAIMESIVTWSRQMQTALKARTDLPALPE